MRLLRRLTAALALSLVASAAAACPPYAPDPDRRTALLDALGAAPDEDRARVIAHEIRLFWSVAPDDRAQELLDRVHDRRRWHDLEAAQDSAEALTVYCPDYAEGWNQLATVLFYRERFDASLDAIVRTLDLEPAHFGALAGRAIILMSQGRVTLGQIALREALAIHPWLSERRLLIPEPGQKL